MEYSIFVPCKLCIIGEYSDWNLSYKTINKEIKKNCAIVTYIDQGINALVSKSDKLIINDRNTNKIEIPFDDNSLKEIINSNNYFSFIVAISYLMKQKYNVEPIKIDITEVTISIGKKLLLSDSICILAIKAYEKIYNINIDIKEKMNLSYEAKGLVHSKFDKIDQVCTLNNQISLIEFDEDIKITPLKPIHNYYFVIANIDQEKDTEKALNNSHKIYSFPESKNKENLIEFFGETNNKFVSKAKNIIENKTPRELGELLMQYQEQFDKIVAPFSTELESPYLHKLLNDDYIQLNSFGSQGDETIQILVKNKEEQKQMIRYLKKQYHLKGYSFVIKEVKNK